MGAAARSYRHRGGETPLLGATIPQHFAAVVERHAEREAVVALPQRRRLSYRAFAAAVDELARGIAALGFARGERIGVWSTNNVEWLLLQMATARIGAVLVNINPAYRTRELGYALKRSEVQGLFLIPRFRSSDYVAMALELVPELRSKSERLASADFPQLRKVVLYDPAAPRETQRPADGFGLWQEVIAAGAAISPGQLDALSAALDRDDPINIQYTSGTTGFPKAVVLTHHNILNNAYFAARAMRFTEADRLVRPGALLPLLRHGARQPRVLLGRRLRRDADEHFDAEARCARCSDERCTAIHGVPTMFIAELEHPQFAQFDLGSLRTGIMAGAPCPPALMKRVMQEMHCREILIGYGQTEASPVTHLTSHDDSLERRTETVGTNLPHQEVKVIDVAKRRHAALRRGGRGLLSRLPRHARLLRRRGSHAQDDRRERLAALGRPRHHGRRRLPAHHRAAEGHDHPRRREHLPGRDRGVPLLRTRRSRRSACSASRTSATARTVMAWVQLHAGETATEDEIRDYCKGKIAHFKIPQHVWFVDEFPMTVTGKLQKFRMREQALEKLKAA